MTAAIANLDAARQALKAASADYRAKRIGLNAFLAIRDAFIGAMVAFNVAGR